MKGLPLAADRRFSAGLVLLSLLAGLALFAPVVAPGDPAAQPDVVSHRFLGPLATDADGGFHLLGTDRFGRDVFRRLVYGGRVSLAVGGLAALLAVSLGLAVGGVAGFAPGPIDRGLMAITDAVLALPRVPLLLLVVALWQPGAALVIIVLGVTGWMPVARLVRGEVRRVAALDYTAAAAALGVPSNRVLWRHVLPNALTPLYVAAALGVGNAIQLEAGLSFLGLGVQPPAASWGNMIASGRDVLVNAPWVATSAGFMVVLAVLGCTLVGDALQDAFNPAGRPVPVS
ncbi:MAG: ABC transporter permease [Gemmatimonadales bacterium]